MDGSNSGSQGRLDARVVLHHEVGFVPERIERAGGRVEVAEHDFEVRGRELFEHGEVSLVQPPVPAASPRPLE